MHSTFDISFECIIIFSLNISILRRMDLKINTMQSITW